MDVKRSKLTCVSRRVRSTRYISYSCTRYTRMRDGRDRGSLRPRKWDPSRRGISFRRIISQALPCFRLPRGYDGAFGPTPSVPKLYKYKLSSASALYDLRRISHSVVFATDADWWRWCGCGVWVRGSVETWVDMPRESALDVGTCHSCVQQHMTAPT